MDWYSARCSPLHLCCLLLLTLILQGSLVNCQPGPPGYDTCDGHDRCIGWKVDEWSSWSSCSKSCGGGTQSREGVWYCYCDPVIGSDHGWIRCVDIPKETESQECATTCSQQGSYYSSTGCKCYDANGVATDHFPLFYGYCCENDCPRIQWCDKYWCKGPPSTCTQCEQHGSSQAEDQAYWLDSNQCKPRCNWLDHWCWPGTCDTNNQYLASTCQCMQGFVKETPDETTTKCKLVEKPRIETCRLGMEGGGGEAFNSTFVGNTTSCANTRDTFVNVTPAFFHFHFDFAFELPEDPPSPRHKYVHDFSFGIVAASVRLIHYSMNGGVANTVWERAMPEEADCTNQDFNKTHPVGGTLITCRANIAYYDTPPENGDMICHNFKPIGSGFVNIVNLVDMSDPVLHFYDETETDAEKCFRFDFVSPSHCRNQNPPCPQDPLDIGERVQRHPSITAVFKGHFDPPPPGNVTGPSLIEKYLLQVWKMQVNENSQQLALGVDLNYTVLAGTEVLEFEIDPMPSPMMYSIYLHVVDTAGNARIMRRFVLIDNSSSLAIDQKNPMKPISARPRTGYRWQVHLSPIIVNWVDHFYNDWFIHTNHLLPIEPDKQVEGIFDQIDGTLPVSGTPNVHGIISFSYRFDKWSPTANQSSPYQEIPDVTAQQVVLSELQIEDGDTVDVSVLATDINGNTIDDSFRVFVDSSPPVLQNLRLEKNGEKQMSIHAGKDLTEMDLAFEASDPHSSLKTVKWTLGTTPKGREIGEGELSVAKLNTTCPDAKLCSCPIIGPCSRVNFAIDLQRVIGDGVHLGDHNKAYHFSVAVMNEAHLVSVKDVTILVDDSPPHLLKSKDGQA